MATNFAILFASLAHRVAIDCGPVDRAAMRTNEFPAVSGIPRLDHTNIMA
jgi:hypothetical protein